MFHLNNTIPFATNNAASPAMIKSYLGICQDRAPNKCCPLGERINFNDDIKNGTHGLSLDLNEPLSNDYTPFTDQYVSRLTF